MSLVVNPISTSISKILITSRVGALCFLGRKLLLSILHRTRYHSLILRSERCVCCSFVDLNIYIRQLYDCVPIRRTYSRKQDCMLNHLQYSWLQFHLNIRFHNLQLEYFDHNFYDLRRRKLYCYNYVDLNIYILMILYQAPNQRTYS